MKKIIIAATILIVHLTTQAQIKTPQASPRAVLTQMVGLTEVEVNYSRPGAKGRPVFGNLVPFGKLWRTGANENTTISFSDDVIIDGKTLKKGKYALYTVPRIESWDIIFYTTTDNYFGPESRNVVEAGALKSLGIQLGVEQNIWAERLLFQADFISGKHSLGEVVIGGAYYVTKHWVLSAGIQIPTFNSQSQPASVFELTFVP